MSTTTTTGNTAIATPSGSKHTQILENIPANVERPPTSHHLMRGSLLSSHLGSDKNVSVRPSTSVRAVGYRNNSGLANERFNQFFADTAKRQSLTKSPNSSIDETKKSSPQIKYKNLEEKIDKLLISSIVLASSEKTSIDSSKVSASSEALNKAKEAFSLDRTLHRFRHQNGENIFHNFDLTYAVFFNLAEQYERNGMHIEALNTYNIMTKNKMFPNVNQLKLNMGNIYHRMNLFSKALKMYRMAFDSVPNNLKQLRLKITKNIGLLFIHMEQYLDAAASFEFIMSEYPDFDNGIHLILCYYAIGDANKIKGAFKNLCEIPQLDDEIDMEDENNLLKLQHNVLGEQNESHMLLHTNKQQQSGTEIEIIDKDYKSGIIQTEVDSTAYPNEENTSTQAVKAHQKDYIFKLLKTDELANYSRRIKDHQKRITTLIIDLIAPVIEENYNLGYNWCTENIKNSNLFWLANELELNKALVFMHQNNIQQAINTLQVYNRKGENGLTTSALINLSFIYINLRNYDLAEKCLQHLEDMGTLESNVKALINSSVLDYMKNNFSEAQQKLEKALLLDKTNFEANYNLGLLALQTNNFASAAERFDQIKRKLLEPHSVQHNYINYHLAKLQDQTLNVNAITRSIKQQNTLGTLQSYLQVMGISARDTDSRLSEKIAAVYELLNDHEQSIQYYNEAHRINPSDLKIACSIGSYFIKLQAVEKALYYFERAVLADPNEPKLMLRLASCFRYSYISPKQYFKMFEKIHFLFPDNINCIEALIQITKILDMPSLNKKYTLEYDRLKNIQIQDENKAIEPQRNYQMMGVNAYSYEQTSGDNNDNQNVEFSEGIQKSSDPYNYYKQNAYSVSNHTDPLGPPPVRPLTGGHKSKSYEDESDNEELDPESLLPI